MHSRFFLHELHWPTWHWTGRRMAVGSRGYCEWPDSYRDIIILLSSLAIFQLEFKSTSIVLCHEVYVLEVSFIVRTYANKKKKQRLSH